MMNGPGKSDRPVVPAKSPNNAEQSAESTITTILGRTAAYEERVVTRAEILKANVKLEADLKF